MATKITQAKLIKKFLKDEEKKGSLFLLEKYLDALPSDWIDSVMFIATQGMKEQQDQYVVFLDEPDTSRVMKLTAKKEVRLIVFSPEKKKVWNLLMAKEKMDDVPDPVCIFVGGENLRQFCDEKNIFYKSMVVENGDLLSVSTLKYMKKEGEDCRIPA